MAGSGHVASAESYAPLLAHVEARYLNWTDILASQLSRKSSKRMGTSVNACTNSLKRYRYGTIYADPPWSFRNWSAKGTGRNPVSHYDCLNFEALTALPVAELAADDCALFLWAVDPLLDRALELIRAWVSDIKLSASIG